ncbi:unnamed protein product, partial [Ectocarpus fasciculatus]
EIDGETQDLLGESATGRKAAGATCNNQRDPNREVAKEEAGRVPRNDETGKKPSAPPVSEKEVGMPAGKTSGFRRGKVEQTVVGAEQGHPSSNSTVDMSILPQGADQNKEEDPEEIEGGCGEGQRNGDGIAPGTATLDGRPPKLAAVELSTKNPESSEHSGGFKAKGPAGRDSKGSSAALCVTWRGKRMTLPEPFLISLKESTLRPKRLELEEKAEKKGQRRERMSTGSKREGQPLTGNPLSSDEGSEPARGPASQGRSGDRRREATLDSESKLGRRTREGNAEPSTRRTDRYLEEKHAGASRRDTVGNEEERRVSHRAESKDSQRTGAPRVHDEHKASPMVQRGTPAPSRRPTRQAVFLSEPYFGPPIAACPRAWPVDSANTMASGTEGRHGHHDRRSHRAGRNACSSPSTSDDSQDKPWEGGPALEPKGNR